MVYNNWWNTSNMNCEPGARLAEIAGVGALKWSAPTFKQCLDGYNRFGERLVMVDNTTQYTYEAMLDASHFSNFWSEYPRSLRHEASVPFFPETAAPCGGFLINPSPNCVAPHISDSARAVS